MRVKLQFAGANDGGDRPTHVASSAESIQHSALRVRWVRWVCYQADALPTYGPWEPVVPDMPQVEPGPGYLG